MLKGYESYHYASEGGIYVGWSCVLKICFKRQHLFSCLYIYYQYYGLFNNHSWNNTLIFHDKDFTLSNTFSELILIADETHPSLEYNLLLYRPSPLVSFCCHSFYPLAIEG